MLRLWLRLSFVMSAVASPVLVTDRASLLAALASTAPSISLSTSIPLAAPLVLSRPVELLGSADAALTLPCAAGASVVVLSPAASGSTLRGLRIACTGAPPPRHALPAALLADGASRLLLTSLVIAGGAQLRGVHDSSLSFSDISNAVGANAGTCVNVFGCGHSPSLTPCNVTVHDNLIHDCRFDGNSIYDASAQGVLIGAADGQGGASPCATGVIVRNNDLAGIDEMGIRVSSDTLCANPINQLVLNRVRDWGQASAKEGGDRADSGCLYSYGHWYSPGNNFSYNMCISSNASWGQNGLYFDDASTGNVAVGNIFVNATAGIALKLNGGAFNRVDSNVVIGGIGAGDAACRGLRPPENYIYTCENNNTGRRWMGVLEANNYTSGAWAMAFPWYADWCTAKTAGPFDGACAPAGAPPAYECAALPRGNAVRNFAGVAMKNNGSFSIPTAAGFPFLDPNSPCPAFVVEQQFNVVGQPPAFFYEREADVFVDPAAGDFTIRPDAPIWRDMPTFQNIPFHQIGIGGSGRA